MGQPSPSEPEGGRHGNPLSQDRARRRGQGSEAAAFAAEISKYVTEIMGMPTVWGMQVGGTFGRVHWFTDYENMTEFEAGLVKTLTDDGYISVLAKAKDLFIEGSSEDSIIYMM